MCPHTPTCPDPHDPAREAARTIISHPEQGWSLLCNGVVLFDDNAELLPDGCVVTQLSSIIPRERAESCGRRRTHRPQRDAAA